MDLWSEKNKKKKILYLTNIESPYRTAFFNEFSKACELTVLYEREKSKNRNEKWAKSITAQYKKLCFGGLNISNENAFSLRFILEIFHSYDEIIVGCYNSPIQMVAILLMRLLHKKYIVNIDGEVFITNSGMKSYFKKFFLQGADKYLVAGEVSARHVKHIFPKATVIPYKFSSLFENEIKQNVMKSKVENRGGFVLVVGQYFDYKGLDVAVKVAKRDKSIQYKFVGMGNRTDLFLKEQDIKDITNVEVIPFLTKEELEKEYRTCAMFLLPSKQECWGLVINEAASFGTPIVSTWGSGAAVEFLAESEFSCFLADANDEESLYEKICKLMHYDNKELYSSYLIKKSMEYTIEENVKAYMMAINN